MEKALPFRIGASFIEDTYSNLKGDCCQNNSIVFLQNLIDKLKKFATVSADLVKYLLDAGVGIIVRQNSSIREIQPAVAPDAGAIAVFYSVNHLPTNLFAHVTRSGQ